MLVIVSGSPWLVRQERRRTGVDEASAAHQLTSSFDVTEFQGLVQCGLEGQQRMHWQVLGWVSALGVLPRFQQRGNIVGAVVSCSR